MSQKKRKKRRATPPEAAQRRAAMRAATAPVQDEPKEKPRRSGQFQDVTAVVKPDMIAYKFYREWWKARSRGDFEFIYELSAEGSALREHFGDKASFYDVCRRKIRPVFGTTEGEVRKIRLHTEDEGYLFHCIDLDARERREYDVERWFMIRDPKIGWRVHAIDRITVSKDKAPNTLTLEDFPELTYPEGFTPANA